MHIRKNYLSSFQILNKEDPKLCLTEDFLVHIVELTKLKPVNIAKLNELEAWIFMIREAHKLEKDGLKPILEKYPNLEDALLELEFLSSNDELVAIYDARVKAERDYRSRLEAQMELGYNTGLEMGIERGIEKGIEKGRREGEKAKEIQIAIQMKQNGFSSDQISKITNLSISEIEAL